MSLCHEGPPSGRRKHPNWGHPDHDACGTGFVAQLGSPPSHDIIQYALTALERLTHRGGVDADGASGDGAGLLTSIPEAFFRARAGEQGIELPEHFGLGFAFFPAAASVEARAAVEAAADTERLRILGWRRVPVQTASLGRMAFETMPETWQFFVAPFHATRGPSRFEWRLALLRKRAESVLPARCYICSLSSQTVVYKGLLTPWQFPQFYEDLRDPCFATTFAVFHQRYSTNTQPSWHLAQPFRYSAHNGEINTIISNRRWLRAKDRELRAKLNAGSWFRILEENVSDSASFDNAFEQKLLEGFSPEAAMLSMVPPAFENDPLLSRDVRGALASLHRKPLPQTAALAAAARRVIVLEDLVDHTNVGAIFRCAAALGVDAVFLSPRCADPLYRRAVKVSMGAVFTIPYARMNGWYDGLAGLRAAGFRLLALTPDRAAAPIGAAVVGQRIALLLGSEGDGLSSRWLHEADQAVRIPMHPGALAAGVDSLNVVAAAAIACHVLVGADQARPR